MGQFSMKITVLGGSSLGDRQQVFAAIAAVGK